MPKYRCPVCQNKTYLADCTSCGYAKGDNVAQFKAEREAAKLGRFMREIGISASQAGEALRKVIDCIPEDLWRMLEDEIKRRGLK